MISHVAPIMLESLLGSSLLVNYSRPFGLTLFLHLLLLFPLFSSQGTLLAVSSLPLVVSISTNL